MYQIERRPAVPLGPAWATWMGLWFSLAPVSLDRPATPHDENRMACQEFWQDVRYGWRTGLPGIDPDRDLRVTVENGVLTLTAQRWHGTRTFSARLPEGVDSDDIVAVYRDGVLEVSMPLEPDDAIVAWMDEIRPENATVPVQHPA